MTDRVWPAGTRRTLGTDVKLTSERAEIFKYRNKWIDREHV